jgi:hypothetical protein
MLNIDVDFSHRDARRLAMLESSERPPLISLLEKSDDVRFHPMLSVLAGWNSAGAMVAVSAPPLGAGLKVEIIAATGAGNGSAS